MCIILCLCKHYFFILQLFSLLQTRLSVQYTLLQVLLNKSCSTRDDMGCQYTRKQQHSIVVNVIRVIATAAQREDGDKSLNGIHRRL